MMRPTSTLRRVVPMSTDGDLSDGLGFGFWAKGAAIFFLGAIVLFICTIVFLHAIYAWGIFAALMVLAVGALVFGWIHDRRNHPATE
jgi:hypothetical protein